MRQSGDKYLWRNVKICFSTRAILRVFCCLFSFKEKFRGGLLAILLAVIAGISQAVNWQSPAITSQATHGLRIVGNERDAP